MPGFLATCFVDRKRRTGVVAFANATAGMPAGTVAVDLLDELEASEPTVAPAWRPSTERARRRSARSLGRLALGLRRCYARPGRATRWSPAAAASRPTGTSGRRRPDRRDQRLHAGEELKVVRSDDGSINHLDLGDVHPHPASRTTPPRRSRAGRPA